MYKNIVLKGVIDYPNLFKARSFKTNEDKFFSCVLIIDKHDSETIKKYEKVFQELKEEQAKTTDKFRPALFKTILRDGDLEKPDEEAYANKYFINVKQKATDENAKAIPVLKKKSPTTYMQIEEKDNEIYAGCRVAVEIQFFNYNSNGSTGVSAKLIKVLKTGDGSPIQRAQYEDNNTNCFDNELVDYEIDESVPF